MCSPEYKQTGGISRAPDHLLGDYCLFVKCVARFVNPRGIQQEPSGIARAESLYIKRRGINAGKISVGFIKEQREICSYQNDGLESIWLHDRFGKGRQSSVLFSEP